MSTFMGLGFAALNCATLPAYFDKDNRQMSTALDACSVAPVNSVAVQLDDIPWQFAVQNGDKIAAFWELK